MTNEELMEALNRDLAGELQAIVQYLQHSYVVLGLNRLPISELLEDIAEDEMKHAKALAERIVGMGGIPTVEPRPIQQSTSIREMLQYDLEAEKGALADYAQRIKEAETAGEMGTALMLEDILVDEQKHHDEFVKLLRE
ncbi:MAG: bacterioferritin [Anaerolineae bacterium]